MLPITPPPPPHHPLHLLPELRNHILNLALLPLGQLLVPVNLHRQQVHLLLQTMAPPLQLLAFRLHVRVFRLQFQFLVLEFLELLLDLLAIFAEKQLAGVVGCGGGVTGEVHEGGRLVGGVLQQGFVASLALFLVLLLEHLLLQVVVLFVQRLYPLLVDSQLVDQVFVGLLLQFGRSVKNLVV